MRNLKRIILSAMVFISLGSWAQQQGSESDSIETVYKAIGEYSLGVSATSINIFDQVNSNIDQVAIQAIEQMPAQQRPVAVLSLAMETERLWLANGWTKCSNQDLQTSEKTPFGFRVFDKEKQCFFSIVENSWAWLTSFMSSSARDQGLFFATIEKVRRAFANTNNQRQQGVYRRR